MSRPPPRAILSLAEIASLDLPEVIAIIAGYITVGLNLLAGKRKTGKSWLAFLIAYAVAYSGRFFNKSARKGRVIYFALEDNLNRVKKRAETMGINLEEVNQLMVTLDMPLISQGGDKYIRKLLAQYPDTVLVIIDTLAKATGAQRGTGNAYNDDSALGHLLQGIAQEHGIAILLVQHIRKAPSEDLLDTISGTAGIPGAADTILVLQKARNKSDADLYVVSRDFEEHEERLEFHAATGTWTLMGDTAELAMSQQRQDILRVVRSANRPVGPSYVAETLDEPVNNIRVSMQRMLKDDQLASPSRGLYTCALGALVLFGSTEGTDSTESTHSTQGTEEEREGSGWRE